MFSQDPAFWREASGNRFYDDFEFDVGRILEAKLAHISPFGRRGDKRMHVFWKSANELDLYREQNICTCTRNWKTKDSVFGDRVLHLKFGLEMFRGGIAACKTNIYNISCYL